MRWSGLVALNLACWFALGLKVMFVNRFLGPSPIDGWIEVSLGLPLRAPMQYFEIPGYLSLTSIVLNAFLWAFVIDLLFRRFVDPPEDPDTL